MAKAKTSELKNHISRVAKKHKRHAKRCTHNKGAKNYAKKYRGQGR